MATIGFAGAVALAASIAMGGCFRFFVPVDRDPCQAATNHLVECGIAAGGGMRDPPPACMGVSECTAECTNKADCDQLKDAFGGTPGATSMAFLACSEACSVAK